jgi:hypothetical protein
VFTVLVCKLVGKRPLERTTRVREDDVELGVIAVQFLAGPREFSPFRSVQIGSETHLFTYPGGKASKS